MHALSGEEDPWVSYIVCHIYQNVHMKIINLIEFVWNLQASHSMLDVVYATHNKNDQRTEYAVNDWDSDIEDSNSSEEFVYTKEKTDLYEYMQNHSNSITKTNSNNTEQPASSLDTKCDAIESDANSQNDAEAATSDEQPSGQEIWNVWNSHEDLIAVSTNGMNINQLSKQNDDTE